MAEGKIEVTVAGIGFSGEGDQDWLGEQLNKILAAATELSKIQPPAPSGAGAGGSATNSQPPGGGSAADSPGPLVSYIKSKSGESNQVKRFLATADWIRLRGESELTTLKVTKALSDNHQKRLGNPADCLNQNVRKGHCEKKGEGFFITPEGFKDLGYPS